jgi:hypothetical protein
MLRRGAVATGALLGAFHLWLLGSQLWRGQLAEPEVVVRWLLAAALLAGWIAWRRRSQRRLDGRRAVVVWLLAALLHGPALADDLDGFATPSLPAAAATLTQSALSLSALGLALLALAVLGCGGAQPGTPFTGHGVAPLDVPRSHPARVHSLPRPPPAS